MPSGKAAAMFFGVMSVGASGKRVSHWFMDVSGSCAGYCLCSCASLCFIEVCASGFVSAHAYVWM